MSKISLLAKLTCAEGKNDELEAALVALIEAAETEPGLEVYSANRAEGDVYWFFEVYSDQAAFDVHGKGDEMRAAMGAVGACLGAAPEISMMTPVTAKGHAV